MRLNLRRSRSGSTTSLEIMVLSVSVATTIMAVAAESPPINTKVLKKAWSWISGSANTKLSGEKLLPILGWIAAVAIGIIIAAVSNKYSGKAQRAVNKWRLSWLSTTVTWNCRGKQIMAAAAISDWPIKLKLKKLKLPQCCQIDSVTLSPLRVGKLNKVYKAKPATAISAMSFIIDSKATASISPERYSVTSTLRVPKNIANSAIINVAVRVSISPDIWLLFCKSKKLVLSAFNCSAI